MGAEDDVHIPTTTTSPSSSPNNHHLIFSYGTLKQGFSNHVVLQNLIATHNAAFLGHCTTAAPLPLVCGPFRVPFLLNLPHPHLPRTHPVSGELYSLSPSALSLIDDLEGVDKGHYERLPLNVIKIDGEVVEVEAYYAHRSYAEEMWRRSGEKGFRCYTEVEARGYVKRQDRPKDVTFLEHIRMFLDSKDCS